jgi:hypothetical protein
MWLHSTSESLTWDPTTLLYEEQEAVMTNYSSNIVSNAALRGHGGNLVINLLSSLTTDLADVTDNDNFYQVSSSNVQISRGGLAIKKYLGKK